MHSCPSMPRICLCLKYYRYICLTAGFGEEWGQDTSVASIFWGLNSWYEAKNLLPVSWADIHCHRHMWTHTHTYILIHTRTYTYTCILTCTHTHIHTYLHTLTHTHPSLPVPYPQYCLLFPAVMCSLLNSLPFLLCLLLQILCQPHSIFILKKVQHVTQFPKADLGGTIAII